MSRKCCLRALPQWWCLLMRGASLLSQCCPRCFRVKCTRNISGMHIIQSKSVKSSTQIKAEDEQEKGHSDFLLKVCGIKKIKTCRNGWL